MEGNQAAKHKPQIAGRLSPEAHTLNTTLCCWTGLRQAEGSRSIMVEALPITRVRANDLALGVASTFNRFAEAFDVNIAWK